MTAQYSDKFKSFIIIRKTPTQTFCSLFGTTNLELYLNVLKTLRLALHIFMSQRHWIIFLLLYLSLLCCLSFVANKKLGLNVVRIVWTEVSLKYLLKNDARSMKNAKLSYGLNGFEQLRVFFFIFFTDVSRDSFLAPHQIFMCQA